MTVKELIEELKKLPEDTEVYHLGGEYKDDYRKVRKVKPFRSWGISGVCIDD